MRSIVDRNFATIAMLVAFIAALAAVVILILMGRCNDTILSTLGAAVTGLAGALGGYSMHRSSDTSVQTPSVQVSKTETGA